MDFSQFSKDDLIDYAEQNNIEIDKRWSVERIAKVIEAAEGPSAERILDGVREINAVLRENLPPNVEAINSIALRIWEGQSPDLPIRERVTRIKAGLKRLGFDDVSGLTLPTKEDYKRYL